MANDFQKIQDLVQDAFNTGYNMGGMAPVAVNLQRQLTVISKTMAIFEIIEQSAGVKLHMGNLENDGSGE